MSVVVESLARRYETIKPHLTERQRRVWLGSEARELGSGGVALVADAVRVSRDTVRRGRTELDDPTPLPVGRSRGRGGGRKRAEEHDPELVAALDRLVDPDSRGDPMTPLRWTSKSLRSLADQLRVQGHQVSPTLVQRLLHEAGYSLQSNTKTLEGSQHPDRDAQFRHIHDTVAASTAKRRNSSASTRTTARITDPPATRRRSRSTISSARRVKRSLTVCMTWAPTPDGCRWVPTTRPPRSP
jgi:transposase